MDKDVKDTKNKVELVDKKVEVAEQRLDVQDQKISDIMSRIDSLNQTVSAQVHSYDDLKKYIDDNVATLKEFIGEVVKKLPLPFDFTAEGIVRRTLTLYFQCDAKENGCLHPKEKPFKTETGDWAKWLKMSFSLFKIGKAFYDKSPEDVYSNIMNLYGTFQSKEDANFVSYISQPFLTSAEQDSLINQLRDQRFFDVFEYNAQAGNWMCAKCGNRKRKGSSEIPRDPISPKEGLRTHLKVSIGLLKHLTKVFAVYEENSVSFYESEKKKQMKNPNM